MAASSDDATDDFPVPTLYAEVHPDGTTTLQVTVDDVTVYQATVPIGQAENVLASASEVLIQQWADLVEAAAEASGGSEERDTSETADETDASGAGPATTPTPD